MSESDDERTDETRDDEPQEQESTGDERAGDAASDPEPPTEESPTETSSTEESSKSDGMSEESSGKEVFAEDSSNEEPPTEETFEAEEADDDTAGPVLPVKKDHVEDMLVELAEIAEESGLNSLAAEVREDRIPTLREGRMSVVVLGEFNHGKSTVVNSLLGEEILPTGITPTTAVITHLVHGDEPAAALQPPRGGDRVEVAYEEMGEAIRHEEQEGEEPEYVEIQYPNELLEDSLILVDTPGVNDISRQKVEITYGYVPKADVIVYVLDATQVLKKSEITFIKDRLLKANRDRIIFVLGKTDALSDEDVGEVESYARERLEGLIGDVELFAFSGREALRAQKEGKAPPEDFSKFREYLLGFLRENKAYILVDSALGSGLRIAGLLEQNLAIKKQGYLLERKELEERITKVERKLEQSRQLIAENIDHIEESIGGIAATARHNLRTFVEEFKETLPQQIERAEARDVKLYLSAWIQDSFKEWLEEEGERVADNLEELAEEVIEITNQSMRETVGVLREELGLRDKLDLEVDTIAYDVSVFALGTVGLSVLLFANALVGGLLALTAPVLAVFFKGRVDEKVKERAREEGLR
ncbi:MAG: dynamin family protein, partial [Persicimonas sp.]